ncbi:hypothetical protein niasHS_016400 [Heterodera schachtii]|uniref:Uncharacterized protein n=1 Tax=Heterodera schachtii TaxID=97005 RepID=A0ABD2HQW9_HETSC
MLDPYKQQPNFFLPHPNHYDHPDQHWHRQRTHRQHRSAAVAGPRAVGPLMPPPPPQRMPSPNCCSSSAATSSAVSEPISLDLATGQYFVKEKENWPAGRFSRRVPSRPLRRTAGAEQHGLVIPLNRFRTKNFSRHPNNDAFDGFDDDTSDLTTSDSELGRLGTEKPVDVRDDLDILPLPRPLKLSKEWRPLFTVSGDSALKVQIQNGAYFLKSLPISSFVKHTTQSQQCFFHYDDHQSHLPMNDKCITNSPYAAGGSSISDFVAQLPPAPPLLVHIAVPFLLIAATFVGLLNSTVALDLYFQFRVVLRTLDAMHCAHCPVDINSTSAVRMCWLEMYPASGARPPSSPAPLADFARALHDLNQNGKRVRERLRRVAQIAGLSGICSSLPPLEHALFCPENVVLVSIIKKQGLTDIF